MKKTKSKKQKRNKNAMGNVGTTNYPVGDFLIRLKNAKLAKIKRVSVSQNKFVKELAKTLKDIGFIDEISDKEGRFEVTLKYHKKEPILLGLKLVSKPGLRIYMDVRELEKIRGPEIVILSTNKGLMTAKNAIKKRIGGEVIVRVW